MSHAAQNSTKFIELVARNAGGKRVEGLRVFVVKLFSLLRNVLALGLSEVSHLGRYLEEAGFVREVGVITLKEAVIHRVSAFSVFEARPHLDDVRNTWLQRRDAISREAVGSHLRLALIKLQLVL